jgi:predicted tellurium resistance membrane protein TerC
MDCRSINLGRLITLIVIELVLGIDNLVFIAILAEKLPRRNATAPVSQGCCWRW